ncbi:MAG: Tim44 domain-containing protein [Betaproteobacteria bacterium]
MKSFALMAAALVLGFTLAAGDAEAAKRLGSGKSSGMQRDSVTSQKSTNAAPAAPAPSQAAAPSAAKPQAAPGAAQPKRSWMGPLAGLAAGLGLAALASHFGFGEELASMLMIGLLVMAVLVVVGLIMRRRAAAQQPAMAGAGANGMQYSGAGAGDAYAGGARLSEYAAAPSAPAPVSAAGNGPFIAAAPVASIPVGFDAEAFVRAAKVNFIRLQAANDAGNLDDIREFTTPEMFAEIKMNFADRGEGSQQTDVVAIDAQVLEVVEEGDRYIVSVRFNGMIREDQNAAAEPFDEVWNMVKPVDGSRGWVLAGIQQL